MSKMQALIGGFAPTSKTIRIVGQAVVVYILAIQEKNNVVAILQNTYRIVRNDINIGHVSNYVVLTTGHTLRILGFRVTVKSLLATLLHCACIYDAVRNLVIIPPRLAKDWCLRNPIQYALFADPAHAAALSLSMTKFLEAQKPSPVKETSNEALAKAPIVERSEPSVEQRKAVTEGKKPAVITLEVSSEDCTPIPPRGKKTRRRRDIFNQFPGNGITERTLRLSLTTELPTVGEAP